MPYPESFDQPPGAGVLRQGATSHPSIAQLAHESIALDELAAVVELPTTGDPLSAVIWRILAASPCRTLDGAQRQRGQRNDNFDGRTCSFDQTLAKRVGRLTARWPTYPAQRDDDGRYRCCVTRSVHHHRLHPTSPRQPRRRRHPHRPNRPTTATKGQDRHQDQAEHRQVTLLCSGGRVDAIQHANLEARRRSKMSRQSGGQVVTSPRHRA